MTETTASVLLIEDDPTMAALVSHYLEGHPYQLDVATTGKQGLSLLADKSYDSILLDLGLPDMPGQDVLAEFTAREYPGEVIVVTGDCSMTTVVEVMQAGARDFVAKPFARGRLLTTLKNGIERQHMQQELTEYRETLDRTNFEGFIGSSLVMQRVYQIIESAAQSRATTFITGESGTGKEVCAQAIHRHSERRNKPFIAINCGAIPKDLIESEIFGHVKGAFTGALKERDGAARAAHGGTLFLDEICEMDLLLQTRLLRFLQTGTLQKVGSDRVEPVDVRILCATNKDPMQQVASGEFREDLFYRLHVLPIHLPPLRERDNDIIEIAQAMLQQYAAEEGKPFATFSHDTERALARYPWPGNVRQLQNVIRNIVVLHQGEEVTAAMLPAPLDGLLQGDAFTPPPPVREGFQPSDQVPLNSPDERPLTQRIRPLAEVEREAIENAISLCEGSVPEAAHYLGISAATIYRKRNSWKKQAE